MRLLPLLLLFSLTLPSLILASVPSKASGQFAAQGKKPTADKHQVYGIDSDFVGAWAQVPVDTSAHLQRDLEDDRKYVASILRTPLDLGDPELCTHKDLEKDRKELKKVARRLNNRRIALTQQSHWIIDAQNGIAKIQEEVRQTKATSKNLKDQLGALETQKQIIMNHVRQQVLQQELDAASIHLARLAKPQAESVAKTESELDKQTLAGHAANEKLKTVRSTRLANLKKITAKKNAAKPRFHQVDSEAESQQETQTETETETETDADADADSETQAEAETETESESSNEAEAEESSE